MTDQLSCLPRGFELVDRFLATDEVRGQFSMLRRSIDWRRDEIVLFGQPHLIPRKHQWFGDAGLSYRWSGLKMQASGWPPELEELRDRVSAACGSRFNSVLANLYRDGNDSMGWHADDEPELGEQPVIASLSVGAHRDFQLRRKGTTTVAHNIELTSGSLLIMSGNSQRDWQHAVPKRKRVDAPRINLTFRQIMKAN